VAILARSETPVEVRRGLPGDPEDVAARYLEADLHGLRIASVYLPNGNPVPSPNFDYKQRWMERLLTHTQTLMDSGVPVLTPSLVPRLAAAEVDAEYRGREKPSDHAPVWIRLKD
jgi:exonuclease III